MSQGRLPTKIRYEYIQENNAKPNYTHGVWGGLSPLGEIEVNFYVESDKIPEFSERRMDEEGTLGPEMAPYNENERIIIRNIHSKILINYQTAKALIEWLEEKVESLETEEISTVFTLDNPDSNREQ